MKNILIIILGKRGAGKSTLAKLFVQNESYYHIEMSDILKSFRSSEGHNQIRLRKFVKIVHKKYSASYSVNLIAEMKLLNKSKIVITGIRNIEEIIKIKDLLQNYIILCFYLYSNLFTRLFRVRKRNKRGSFLEFFIEEYYSFKWGDKVLKNHSILIHNNTIVDKTYKYISINYLNGTL